MIVHGNSKMILGLIWVLIRRYQLTNIDTTAIPDIVRETAAKFKLSIDPKEKFVNKYNFLKDILSFSINYWVLVLKMV